MVRLLLLLVVSIFTFAASASVHPRVSDYTCTSKTLLFPLLVSYIAQHCTLLSLGSTRGDTHSLSIQSTTTTTTVVIASRIDSKILFFLSAVKGFNSCTQRTSLVVDRWKLDLEAYILTRLHLRSPTARPYSTAAAVHRPFYSFLVINGVHSDNINSHFFFLLSSLLFILSAARFFSLDFQVPAV